jgi:sugar/nucleoside kinase (ribokinase family)
MADGPAAGGIPKTPGFLVVGHAVQDILSASDPNQWRLGGAACYASLLAHNLGLRTAVLTAAPPGLRLEEMLAGIGTAVVPSAVATQIRNLYEGGRRRQFISQRAVTLTADHLPGAWREAPIVLLGPVAGEVDASLASCFPRSLLGVGAQGWLREIGPGKEVRPVAPDAWDAGPILGPAQAVFLSDEDLPAEDAPGALSRWKQMVEVLAFTRGDGGADIHHAGEWRHIEAFPARAVDPTGAGDVFAAAFLVRYYESCDVWQAARFAACAASFTVEGEGTAAVPGRAQIERRLAEHPSIVAV